MSGFLVLSNCNSPKKKKKKKNKIEISMNLIKNSRSTQRNNSTTRRITTKGKTYGNNTTKRNYVTFEVSDFWNSLENTLYNYSFVLTF